ncbi:putative ATPase (plasmid) [Rickettsiales bacterium Ac37b]|nr:putative ATPase [Rickettsiales bacterium Ac37b]
MLSCSLLRINIIILLSLVCTNDCIAINVVPIVWRAPFINKDFTGRKEELHKLEKLLLEHNITNINGPSGIGKSQIAKQYAHKHNSVYDIVWWFDVQTNVVDQLSDFAGELNKIVEMEHLRVDVGALSTSGIIQFIKDTLRTTNKRWLIVFDGAEKLAQISDYFPETHMGDKKHIIITSLDHYSDITNFNITPFNLEEAKEFFSKITHNHSQEITDIIEFLDCMPLAIQQAASYILYNQLSIKDYLNLLRDNPKDLFKQNSYNTNIKYLNKKNKTLNVTLNLSISRIKEHNPETVSILKALSLLSIRVPKYVLYKVLNNLGIDQVDISKSIKILRDYNMINEINTGGVIYYSLPNVLKEFIRYKYFTPDNLSISKFLNRIFTTEMEYLYSAIMVSLMEYIDQKKWNAQIDFVNANTYLFILSNTVAKNAYNDGIRTRNLFNLLICLVENNNMMFHHKSNYITLQQDIEFLKDVYNKIYTTKEMKKKFFLSAIYGDYIFTDKYNTDYYKEHLLSVLKNVEKNSRDIDVLVEAYLVVAQFYLFEGSLGNSKKYLDKAKLLQHHVNGVSIKTLFWYISTWLSMERGKYDEASKNAEEFLKIAQPLGDYPIDFYAINHFARIHFILGNYTEACIWSKHGYNLAINYYKSKSANVIAELLITIGRCYKQNGQLSEAEKYVNNAIKMFNNFFGGEQVDFSQASAHLLLGEILEEEGKDILAYKEYKFAESIYHKIYKENISEIYEISTIYANLVVLGSKLKDSGMTKRYYLKLVNKYGIDNSNVQRVIDFYNSQSFKLPL